MSDESRPLDGLEDAMISGEEWGAVALDTSDGTELLLHSPGPVYADGGTITIPAEVLWQGSRE